MVRITHGRKRVQEKYISQTIYFLYSFMFLHFLFPAEESKHFFFFFERENRWESDGMVELRIDQICLKQCDN